MLLSDNEENSSRKYVKCGACEAPIFISKDLAPLETQPCKDCGHPVMKPLFLHQIELRQVIASGGMGTVYRSWDHALEREVAVKLMKREFVDDPESVEAFSREARACSPINHTNIVSIYSFDEHNGEKFIVMEVTDNGSLEGRIAEHGRIEEMKALDIGVSMCLALKAALRHDLLHLDIKPDNILFNADNEAKLMDWGIAHKTTDGKMSFEGDDEGVMGTPEFIAPERVQRIGESFLSDMYSLSATLYNALSGHPPFRGEDPTAIAMAHINEPVTPLYEWHDDITETTSDVLIKAMAKDPALRYESYDAFRMALEMARGEFFRAQFMTEN